jgi:ribosomal protein L37AE/L43A
MMMCPKCEGNEMKKVVKDWVECQRCKYKFKGIDYPCKQKEAEEK